MTKSTDDIDTAAPTGNLSIAGMHCASCVRRIEQAIVAVPGVVSAVANLAAARADIVIAPEANREIVLGAATTAIEAIGYKVPRRARDISIDGMHCASCVRRVEDAIRAMPGVATVTVNLATQTAHVEGADWLSADALRDAIERLGYTARTSPDSGGRTDRDAEARAEQSGLRRDLVIAAIATAPVFILEMGGHLVPAFHHAVEGTFGTLAPRVVAFILTTLVLFGPGWRFYRHGIPSLLRGAPDMDALVVLGATAAWAFSTAATFAPALLPPGSAAVYFEAAAVIVTLILLGRLLEARARNRTGDAIRSLLGLTPKTARVRRGDEFRDVGIDEVVIGDVIHVRPGERVPVDGLVKDGHSFVDESMISGEPIPVEKAPAAKVTGGTLNTTGSFTFMAERVGADTTLAQIIRTVETAQGAKLPVQAAVDRVTQWFVPAVLAMSLATFLVWLVFGPQPSLGLAIVNAVAVLIIACPCAMGLATPVSIMVATGRAAQLGILFRKGEALQTLRDATIVALDKTGTITRGQPVLTDLEAASGLDADDILARVAAVEAASEHPIARAIVAAANEKNLRLPAIDGFKARPGFGISAQVDGVTVIVGAARALVDAGIAFGAFKDAAARFESDAKTAVFVAIDGRAVAVLAVADPIRASSPAAVVALKQRGIATAMITGDAERTAQAIARQAGIAQVAAGVLPDGKAREVERLRKEHGPIAFVGDGINDAPALASADVGIAIGTGTDAAIESADIVLMSGDLKNLPTAIALSRDTIRNIHQNLAWAFGYNIVLIPVAAGALYPFTGLTLSPMLAAGAMALSSVFVLTNALRLRRFQTAASPPFE